MQSVSYFLNVWYISHQSKLILEDDLESSGEKNPGCVTNYLLINCQAIRTYCPQTNEIKNV